MVGDECGVGARDAVRRAGLATAPCGARPGRPRRATQVALTTTVQARRRRCGRIGLIMVNLLNRWCRQCGGLPDALQGACQFDERCDSSDLRNDVAWNATRHLPSVGNSRQLLAMERATQVIGQSGAFLDALERASRAAALDRPVLVIGERGTGKELVAERLHRLSPALGPAAGRDELRRAARDADRGRAVRARGGRVHRRDQGAGRAGSRRRTAARCSSTSSARCRWRRRTGCCARSNMARSRGSARRGRSASTSASSPRPTSICPTRSSAARFRADLLDRLSLRGRDAAAAARARGRHRGAGRPFRAAHGGRDRAGSAGRASARRALDAARRLSLAGQRPRAAQRRRARGLSLGTRAADRRDRDRSRSPRRTARGTTAGAAPPSASAAAPAPRRRRRRSSPARTGPSDFKARVAPVRARAAVARAGRAPLQPARDRRRRSA